MPRLGSSLRAARLGVRFRSRSAGPLGPTAPTSYEPPWPGSYTTRAPLRGNPVLTVEVLPHGVITTCLPLLIPKTATGTPVGVISPGGGSP